MKVDVLLGLQWGDEGKGKIVDVLTPKYDIIARFQGGPNAGHTLEIEGDKHVLHIIPSGIFHKEKLNIIGNGVIIDPFIMKNELLGLEAKGVQPKNNLYVSKKAHLILPTHRMLDATYEAFKGEQKIGSTLKGIGPTYTDKTARIGLRVGDILSKDFKQKYEKLKQHHIKIITAYGFDYKSHKIDSLSFDEYEKQWFEALKKIQELKIINSENFINTKLKEGKKILAEGAQGTLLDVDFGSFPFVTSSSTITAGVCSGLGIAPNKINRVFGIVKAYCTRVGSGPFPTELFDADGQKLRDDGHEYGSTTGRPRRCGWLDINALNYSVMLNGVTDLIVTKADVLDGFDTIKVAVAYDVNGEKTKEFDLDIDSKPVYDEIEGWKSDITSVKEISGIPLKLVDYIKYIEEKTEVGVSILSVGPDRDQTIIISDDFK
ncbi:MAG: adenylosuccinate synthase [Bacteroidota bacterium]|nr:adenylosuccinate synthase [Bacteroidota bacterium]